MQPDWSTDDLSRIRLPATPNCLTFLSLSLFVCVSCLVISAATNTHAGQGSTPLDFIRASPRVIEVFWKPGKSGVPHTSIFALFSLLFPRLFFLYFLSAFYWISGFELDASLRHSSHNAQSCNGRRQNMRRSVMCCKEKSH